MCISFLEHSHRNSAPLACSRIGPCRYSERPTSSFRIDRTSIPLLSTECFGTNGWNNCSQNVLDPSNIPTETLVRPQLASAMRRYSPDPDFELQYEHGRNYKAPAAYLPQIRGLCCVHTAPISPYDVVYAIVVNSSSSVGAGWVRSKTEQRVIYGFPSTSRLSRYQIHSARLYEEKTRVLGSLEEEANLQERKEEPRQISRPQLGCAGFHSGTSRDLQRPEPLKDQVSPRHVLQLLSGQGLRVQEDMCTQETRM